MTNTSKWIRPNYSHKFNAITPNPRVVLYSNNRRLILFDEGIFMAEIDISQLFIEISIIDIKTKRYIDTIHYNYLSEFVEDWDIVDRRILIEKTGNII